jgi:transcriptional regulator with XRE-family HTH domain
MNYLAKNIKLLRKHASRNQEDIGLLVNKGQTTIGNWENEKSEPSIEELLIISNFFDISVDLLLKVDLARTNYLSADLIKEEDLLQPKENTVRYSHNEWESLVKEYDERILSHILLEVRSLRQEFNEAKNDRKTSPKDARKTGRKTNVTTHTRSNQKSGPGKKSRPIPGYSKPDGSRELPESPAQGSTRKSKPGRKAG